MRWLVIVVAVLMSLLPAPSAAVTTLTVFEDVHDYVEAGSFGSFFADGLGLIFGSTTPFPEVDYDELLSMGFGPFGALLDPAEYPIVLRFTFEPRPFMSGVYETAFLMEGRTPHFALTGQGTMRTWFELNTAPDFYRTWREFTFTETSATRVPEPTTLLLVLAGMLGVGGLGLHSAVGRGTTAPPRTPPAMQIPRMCLDHCGIGVRYCQRPEHYTRLKAARARVTVPEAPEDQPRHDVEIAAPVN
jgi:hypothetical protein